MENTVNKNAKPVDIRAMVLLALFTAIELIFCFTPLGSLPLGPGIVATLAHIPAIIVAVTMNKKQALYMGLLMGVCSLVIWTFIPPNPVFAFAFSPFAPHGNIFSLLIAILPRAIFPVFACFLYNLLKDRLARVPAAVIASVLASLLHSVLVLGGIYIVFSGDTEISSYIRENTDKEFVEATLQGISANIITFLVAWGGVNAVIEAVIAGVVSGGLIIPLSKINKS